MNRSITNSIRFLMDECLPPFIRDSKFFMYPFYFLAYRGRNIRQIMNFKKEVLNFTAEQYTYFYNNLNSISRNRVTDINEPSLKFILENISKNTLNLLDVGCGNGFFLRQVKKKFPKIELFGSDIMDKGESKEYNFMLSQIENLPLENKSIDVVTCSHTLEHIINPEKAIAELKRIARKQIIIVVPCQRYYYYTLDEHLNFFPFKEALTSIINIQEHTCKKIHGDWVYIGSIAE